MVRRCANMSFGGFACAAAAVFLCTAALVDAGQITFGTPSFPLVWDIGGGALSNMRLPSAKLHTDSWFVWAELPNGDFLGRERVSNGLSPTRFDGDWNDAESVSSTTIEEDMQVGNTVVGNWTDGDLHVDWLWEPVPEEAYLLKVSTTVTNTGTTGFVALDLGRQLDVDPTTQYINIRLGSGSVPSEIYDQSEECCCNSHPPFEANCGGVAGSPALPQEVVDYEDDAASTWNLKLGPLAAGESKTVYFYYGAVPSHHDAGVLVQAYDFPVASWQTPISLTGPDYFESVIHAYGLAQADPPPNVVCSPAEKALCSPWAKCDKSSGEAKCSCIDGFKDVSDGDGTRCEDINECADEEVVKTCDRLSFCANLNGSYACVCPEGFFGGGESCSSNAFAIRTVLAIPGVSEYTDEELQDLKIKYASIILNSNKILHNSSIVETLSSFLGHWTFGGRLLGVAEGAGSGSRRLDNSNEITLFALFPKFEAAEKAWLDLGDNVNWDSMGATELDPPSVYRWIGGSSSDELEIPPTGLTVDSVYFDFNCLSTGCWKVEVTYTRGLYNNAFNVFFLPVAESSDSNPSDPVYTAVTNPWSYSPADTFDAVNHPCSSFGFDAGDSEFLPTTITACCIPAFLDMYRPVDTFGEALDDIATLDLSIANCGSGDRDRAANRNTLPWFSPYYEVPPLQGSYAAPESPSIEKHWGLRSTFVDGGFPGLSLSRVYHRAVVDEYIGIYEARFELDEVEHTIDTFVGLVNFSPTSTRVLDTAATQTAIHLEKTSFFSVSTHGTNDYTFLEYVNVRLVAVYDEDAEADGNGGRTERAGSGGQANFVQVTFTLGAQYGVNANEGLIPTDSVRVGSGTFFDETPMEQKCTQWADGASFDEGSKSSFASLLTQDCAPSTSMCTSPADLPDSFVSYNIPLGIDYFADSGGTADALTTQIFVNLVVSVVLKGSARDDSNANPNEGDAPLQMKTTLTAAVPLVEGGVSIFCDGFTAKTDLKDVADADIVVGSASTAEELTRLRIKQNVASTELDPSVRTLIDSDSIEAGLMTLVLKGNASYFGLGGVAGSSIELEDVVTIHILNDDDTTVDQEVENLLGLAVADTLGPDEYPLNGAFSFAIDRSAQRAHLEPTPALLDRCPFNPPRPVENVPLDVCITRRDVRFRNFPWRTGAPSTAMEICAGLGAPCPTTTLSDESKFMARMLGDGAYSRHLGIDYANILKAKYALNGRYRRAYWINPGYEWTPTQTGGTPVFSVSQKLYLFALITLDDGIALDDAGKSLVSTAGFDSNGPNLRRRMLLQSAPSTTEEALQDGQASVGGEVLEFSTSPRQLLATAFDVPLDLVAGFEVTLQLTREEACLPDVELLDAIRHTLDDFLTGTASRYHSVQVTKLSVDRKEVQCGRRLLLSSFSEATADVRMVVVFEAGDTPTISLEKFATMSGVLGIVPLSAQSVVNVNATKDYVPPADDPAPQAGTDSGSSSDVALYAGAAGAVAAIIAVGIAGFLYIRKRNREREGAGADGELGVVSTLTMDDLKQQLSTV